jgi:hypothetical protein
MLLTGHDEILLEALKAVPEFLPSFADFFQLPEKEVHRLLRLGAHIPDLPQLSYKQEQESLTVSDVALPEHFHVIPVMLTMRDDTSLTKYYHRGFNSFLHAMYSSAYPIPQHTPKTLTRKILAAMTGWLSYCNTLERHPLRIALLGIILHTIVDSYSPSHTFRLTRVQKKARKFECETRRLKKPQMSPGFIVMQALKASGSTPINLWSQKIIRDYFKSKDKWLKWYHRHVPNVELLSNQIQFDKMIAGLGKPYANQISLSPPSDDSYPCIIDFQKGSAVRGIRHFLYDRVKRVKKMGLYPYAVRDITAVLRIFLSSLHHHSDAARALTQYLVRYTFNMSQSEPLKREVRLDIFQTLTCTEY